MITLTNDLVINEVEVACLEPLDNGDFCVHFKSGEDAIIDATDAATLKTALQTTDTVYINENAVSCMEKCVAGGYRVHLTSCDDVYISDDDATSLKAKLKYAKKPLYLHKIIIRKLLQGGKTYARVVEALVYLPKKEKFNNATELVEYFKKIHENSSASTVPVIGHGTIRSTANVTILRMSYAFMGNDYLVFSGELNGSEIGDASYSVVDLANPDDYEVLCSVNSTF